mgnify:CR=1 FL=1
MRHNVLLLGQNSDTMALKCNRYNICLLAHENLKYNLKYKSHESSKKK